MRDDDFIGREQQLLVLKQLFDKKTASLVVITGRRRIGKSRLVEKFCEGHRAYTFSGLAPDDNTSAQHQRDEFAIQLSQQFNMPELKYDDWSKLFFVLSEQVKSRRVILFFDEVTWMAHGDQTFLSKLKNAWDLHFKKNKQLILILCSSVSAWVEKNIISSTGYLGRISEKITLQELSLANCNSMLDKLGFRKSVLEKFMILSVTGGIPWYLEQINPKLSAADNIKRLCFSKDGILVNEFQHIFYDLFGRRRDICRRITETLARGPADLESIAGSLDYVKGGAISDYLEELIVSGFIKRDHTWNLKTGQDSKLSKYRLSDNFLRFYFRYMASKLSRIKKGQYNQVNLAELSGLHNMLGLQFENLVLNNRSSILASLNINANDIVYDNPFFQRKTARQAGCQIDYLIQTKLNTLYVCEIKFSRNPIGTTVISDIEEKIARIAKPKGFTCVPVLIHVNGVTDEVDEQDYFFEIIDFSDFLNS